MASNLNTNPSIQRAPPKSPSKLPNIVLRRKATDSPLDQKKDLEFKPNKFTKINGDEETIIQENTVYQVQILIACIVTLAGIIAFSFLLILTKQFYKIIYDNDKNEIVPKGMDGHVHRISDICTSSQNCNCLSKFCPGISTKKNYDVYKPTMPYMQQYQTVQKNNIEKNLSMIKNSENQYQPEPKVIPKTSIKSDISKKDSCYSSAYQQSLNGCGYTTDELDDAKSLPDLDNCLIISRHSFKQLPVERLLRKTSKTISRTFSISPRNSVQIENYVKDNVFARNTSQKSEQMPVSSTSGIHSSGFPQPSPPTDNKLLELPRKPSLPLSTSSDDDNIISKPRLLSFTKRRGVLQAAGSTSGSDSFSSGSLHKRLSDGSIHDSDYVVRKQQIKKKKDGKVATGRKTMNLGQVGYMNDLDLLDVNRNCVIKNDGF